MVGCSLRQKDNIMSNKLMRRSDIYKKIAGCSFLDGIVKLQEMGFRIIQAEQEGNLRLRRGEQIIWVAYRINFKKRPSWIVIM